MSKLGDIVKDKIIPLESLPGVYVRDLPAKQVEELFKSAPKEAIDNEEVNEESSDFISRIFQELICDADAKVFEDLVDADAEKISSLLSLNVMWSIMKEAPEALLPQGLDLGKLNATGDSK